MLADFALAQAAHFTGLALRPIWIQLRAQTVILDDGIVPFPPMEILPLDVFFKLDQMKLGWIKLVVVATRYMRPAKHLTRTQATKAGNQDVARIEHYWVDQPKSAYRV